MITELQRQVEAHKARLARFAEQAERFRAAKLAALAPLTPRQAFTATEEFIESNPIKKKRPAREWAPRPLDRADPEYPEIVRIQLIVAKHFAVDIYDMLKPGKEGRGSNRVSRARQVAVYFCHKITGKSYPFIARCFGRRDHTTIMYNVRKCERLIETDPYAAYDVKACEALL